MARRPKLAPDAPAQLTGVDVDTIRLALNYAAIERRSYVEATNGSDMVDANERSRKLVERFEKLHRKLFGEPTDETVRAERINAMPSVPIHDIKVTE